MPAKTTMAGDVVYQIDATDPEGDAIEYTVVGCEPAATCDAYQVLPSKFWAYSTFHIFNP